MIHTDRYKYIQYIQIQTCMYLICTVHMTYAQHTYPIGWAGAIGPFPEGQQNALVLSLRRTLRCPRTPGSPHQSCQHMSQEGQMKVTCRA